MSFRPPLPDKCECIVELDTKSTNIVPAVIDAIQKSSEQNIVLDGQYVGFVRLVVVTEQQLIDHNWKRDNRMPITVAFSPTGMPLIAYLRRSCEPKQTARLRNSRHFGYARKHSIRWCSRVRKLSSCVASSRHLKWHRYCIRCAPSACQTTRSTTNSGIRLSRVAGSE